MGAIQGQCINQQQQFKPSEGDIETQEDIETKTKKTKQDAVMTKVRRGDTSIRGRAPSTRRNQTMMHAFEVRSPCHGGYPYRDDTILEPERLHA